MDKFLETYSLPRLNQQETKNLKRPVTTNKIKSVIKRLPTNKNPGPVASQLNVTKSQRRINTYPSQTIPKSKRREGSETHFTRPVLPWYQNQTKTLQKTENYKSISPMNTQEGPQKTGIIFWRAGLLKYRYPPLGECSRNPLYQCASRHCCERLRSASVNYFLEDSLNAFAHLVMGDW